MAALNWSRANERRRPTEPAVHPSAKPKEQFVRAKALPGRTLSPEEKASIAAKLGFSVKS